MNTDILWNIMMFLSPTILIHLILGLPNILPAHIRKRAITRTSKLEVKLKESESQSDPAKKKWNVSFFLLTLVPGINLVLLGGMICFFFEIYFINPQRKVEEDKQKLALYNKMMECAECGVYSRYGSILLHNADKKDCNNSYCCPICSTEVSTGKEVHLPSTYEPILHQQEVIVDMEEIDRQIRQARGNALMKKQQDLYEKVVSTEKMEEAVN